LHKFQLQDPLIDIGSYRRWKFGVHDDFRKRERVTPGWQREKWQFPNTHKPYFGPKMEIGSHRVWQETLPQSERGSKSIELGKHRWHPSDPSSEERGSSFSLGKHRVWQETTPQNKEELSSYKLAKHRLWQKGVKRSTRQNKAKNLGHNRRKWKSPYAPKRLKREMQMGTAPGWSRGIVPDSPLGHNPQAGLFGSRAQGMGPFEEIDQIYSNRLFVSSEEELEDL
jgi:hypothetical protein